MTYNATLELDTAAPGQYTVEYFDWLRAVCKSTAAAVRRERIEQSLSRLLTMTREMRTGISKIYAA